MPDYSRCCPCCPTFKAEGQNQASPGLGKGWGGLGRFRILNLSKQGTKIKSVKVETKEEGGVPIPEVEPMGQAKALEPPLEPAPTAPCVYSEIEHDWNDGPKDVITAFVTLSDGGEVEDTREVGGHLDYPAPIGLHTVIIRLLGDDRIQMYVAWYVEETNPPARMPPDCEQTFECPPP
jgi:hypothetical protein